MGFFQDLFGKTGAQASRDAAAQKQAGLEAGQAYAEPLYGQAKTDISTGYGAAQDAWQPVYNVGQAGANFYADITGANGPEGQARARATFQTDPGYQFAVSEALRATERQGGTGGFQNSANVIRAKMNTADQLANQQWGQYVQRLQPFLGYSLGGASGLAGAYTGEGTALAGLDKSLADLGYGTKAGIGSAQAAGTLGAAQSYTNASTNIFNQGVNLAGKLLGYSMGGGFGGGGNEFGISDDELYGVGARALQA